jgi:hypothetical protein
LEDNGRIARGWAIFGTLLKRWPMDGGLCFDGC